MNPNDEKYPSDAVHVYAQDAHCDEWNTYKLNGCQEKNSQI